GSEMRTTSVVKFPSNAWKLRDMHGNVWEWCEDNWHVNYRGDPPDDGSVWRGGERSFRVVRGGSWGTVPQNLRSAFRIRYNADFHDSNIGFRFARSLSSPSC